MIWGELRQMGQKVLWSNEHLFESNKKLFVSTNNLFASTTLSFVKNLRMVSCISVCYKCFSTCFCYPSDSSRKIAKSGV